MNPKEKKLSGVSRVFLLFCAISLMISIFVPLWIIELSAPQYPEGLNLLIYSNKLGGNVDIINGLNHYIGMKTLHANDFVEFTVLPYIIGFFALASLIVSMVGRKRGLYLLFTLFLLFGIIAMVDFWRWEYNYGHNLNPEAAIIVPGMAYQPPLIGFKQLLNFGAYSIPTTGGWLFVVTGLIMLLSVIMEVKPFRKRVVKPLTMASSMLLFLFITGCRKEGPEPIKLNSDNCTYCKMTIADSKFATELITNKGRVYKFDDMSCMINYMKDNTGSAYKEFYVADYNNPSSFIKANEASLIKSESTGSPMGGNIAAFSKKETAVEVAEKFSASFIEWNSISK